MSLTYPPTSVRSSFTWRLSTMSRRTHLPKSSMSCHHQRDCEDHPHEHHGNTSLRCFDYFFYLKLPIYPLNQQITIPDITFIRSFGREVGTCSKNLSTCAPSLSRPKSPISLRHLQILLLSFLLYYLFPADWDTMEIGNGRNYLGSTAASALQLAAATELEILGRLRSWSSWSLQFPPRPPTGRFLSLSSNSGLTIESRQSSILLNFASVLKMLILCHFRNFNDWSRFILF
jgi:hypothetical protein